MRVSKTDGPVRVRLPVVSVMLHGFALLVMALLSILLGLWLLSAFGLGASWRQSFLAEFVIENRSSEKVRVTALGVGPDGNIAVLPQVVSKERPGRYKRPKEWAIGPGGSRTVIYNWDDINFTWIAVRGETGPWKVVRTGLPLEARDPTGRTSFTRPDEQVYVIPRLEGLPNAPADVRSAAAARSAG